MGCCDACSWRYSFTGSVCVFRRVLVSVGHPVAILSAVYCVICSLLMFVYYASGDHNVNVLEYGSCYGVVCCDDRFLFFPTCC